MSARRRKSALSAPTDWILRYIKHAFTFNVTCLAIIMLNNATQMMKPPALLCQMNILGSYTQNSHIWLTQEWVRELSSSLECGVHDIVTTVLDLLLPLAEMHMSQCYYLRIVFRQ